VVSFKPDNRWTWGSAGFFVYRNSERDRDWIDASNSSGLLSFFFNLLKFPGQSSSPATQNRVVTCVTAVSRLCCPSARSRWPISTAIGNYRPTVTGFLPLDGGSTASLSLTAVDAMLFTPLFISLTCPSWLLCYFFLFLPFWPGGAPFYCWLRHCATNQKVAVSIPDGVIGILHWHNPSDRTMGLESTQPITEMSTRDFFLGVGGKDGRCVGLTTLPPSCANCPEIWEPQPPGILRACPGIAIPFNVFWPIFLHKHVIREQGAKEGGHLVVRSWVLAFLYCSGFEEDP